MIAPFILSWLFVTIQWFKTERGLVQKLKTLPLLILQVYPQWRALRVLFYAKWKKYDRWQRMKEEWETGISHLGKRMIKNVYNFGLKTYETIVSEPFLESVPQVHMLLVIFILSIQSINTSERCDRAVVGDTLFFTTFSTSIVTASFGISKFIKSGPTRIVKNDKCLMGFGTLSFLLIFTNIALTLVGKGCIIAFYVFEAFSNNMTYLVLLLLCFIPQLLHVSSNHSKVRLLLLFDQKMAIIQFLNCLYITVGMHDSLPLPWYQKSNINCHCPSSLRANTRLQLLDFRASYIWMLCLQEGRAEDSSQLQTDMDQFYINS